MKVIKRHVIIDIAKNINGRSKLCKKISCPNCTNRRIGTTKKSESCVADRTVFAFKDKEIVNKFTSNTAESAPRIEATAATIGISRCPSQYAPCVISEKIIGNGRTAKSFPQKRCEGLTGESCNSSSELRSRSPAKLSAAKGAPIGAMRQPSKSIM